MFGYVTASWKELTAEQQKRYSSVYCGICRAMHRRCGGLSKLCLSYDMVFLALLEASLYEPEETAGRQFCGLHPIRRRQWIMNRCTDYAADMNAALAYYKAQDDVNDDGSLSGKALAKLLEPCLPRIRADWPRQCGAIESCIGRLAELERENSSDPDACASCFGTLMAELLVMEEDQWQEPLRSTGMYLGRFIYLADAMADYEADAKKKRYNPFLAAGIERDPDRWEQYLVMAMAGCTGSYEKLPLVQDKAILDNILYSGVWVMGRGFRKKEERHG